MHQHIAALLTMMLVAVSALAQSTTTLPPNAPVGGQMGTVGGLGGGTSTTERTVEVDSNATSRRVTAVRPDNNTVKRPDRNTDYRLVEKYVTGDTTSIAEDERRDSIKRAYPRYPRLTDVTIGVNFVDPLLMALGQKYGGMDVSVTLNMWNRLQPVVELGAGRAKSTPDDMNFTYKGKLSPYVKAGVNYNFTFKSEPRYQALIGARIAYSTFKYDITDITYFNGYWHEENTFSIMGEKSNALWVEVVAGLKVQLWKAISMGWMVKYHGLLNHKSNVNSEPWYIPGFGSRTSKLGIGLSLYYTIPLSVDKWPKKKESVAESK